MSSETDIENQPGYSEPCTARRGHCRLVAVLFIALIVLLELTK